MKTNISSFFSVFAARRRFEFAVRRFWLWNVHRSKSKHVRRANRFDFSIFDLPKLSKRIFRRHSRYERAATSVGFIEFVGFQPKNFLVERFFSSQFVCWIWFRFERSENLSFSLSFSLWLRRRFFFAHWKFSVDDWSFAQWKCGRRSFHRSGTCSTSFLISHSSHFSLEFLNEILDSRKVSSNFSFSRRFVREKSSRTKRINSSLFRPSSR